MCAQCWKDIEWLEERQHLILDIIGSLPLPCSSFSLSSLPLHPSLISSKPPMVSHSDSRHSDESPSSSPVPLSIPSQSSSTLSSSSIASSPPLSPGGSTPPLSGSGSSPFRTPPTSIDGSPFSLTVSSPKFEPSSRTPLLSSPSAHAFPHPKVLVALRRLDLLIPPIGLEVMTTSRTTYDRPQVLSSLISHLSPPVSLHAFLARD